MIDTVIPFKELERYRYFTPFGTLDDNLGNTTNLFNHIHRIIVLPCIIKKLFTNNR